MKWNQYDERLRKLYNAIATSHSETVSYATSEKSEKEPITSEISSPLLDNP